MWRAANPLDDDAIARMCLALNAEDPGPEPVPPAYTRRTLVALRESPWRGHAAVLDVDGQVCGYALVISFWSNELGGKVWVIDEIYVDPEHRGRGYATQFLEDLAAGAAVPDSGAIALMLGVAPGNVRARSLYERLGFRPDRNIVMLRPLRR